VSAKRYLLKEPKTKNKEKTMLKFTPLNLTLPTEKSVPVTDISKFSVFVYGKQGIGKTSFTAQFPDAIHLMFEPGGKTEQMYQVFPENWEQVVEYTRLIKATNQYKNIVIDTIDLMFDMCCEQVCKDNGVKMLKDIGFGDGYNQAGTKFRDVLTDLHSNKGLIMLAHDKEKMKTDDSEPTYIVPSTAKRGAETVAKWVDLTCHYYIDRQGRRQLRVRTSVDREAKNRIKGRFMYTNGTPMNDIYMGTNEFEAYANFMKAFNNSLDAESVKPTEPQKQETKKQFTLRKES